MKHSILIIDDHKIVRDGLKAMLLGNDQYEVVGEASSCEQGLLLAEQLLPKIIFIDLKLPDGNGADLAKKLLSNSPSSRCVLLTAEPNARDLQEAKSCGVLGFLSKEIDTDEYLKALSEVAQGKIYIAQVVHHYFAEQIPNLTDREVQVLEGFANGFSYKEIGGQLGISPRTVEAHKLNLLAKLGEKTIIEMVRKSTRLGILKG